jgi:voltage-gated potassium channel
MTTVGYGDVYPVTPEGRLAASILMVLGIGLFGVVTATITGLVVRNDGSDASPEPDPLDRLGALFALAQRGAISESEYAAKKAELMERI